MGVKQKIIILLAILIIISNTAFAHNEKGKARKVYMVILNRTTLEDMLSMKTVKELIEEGSLGLMNTRGLFNYNRPESYITINTSSRSYSNYNSAMFYNIDKNSSQKNMYIRRTGNKNVTSRIANIEQNKLIKLNEGREYYSYIGALGDNLHKASLKTAVFGNSDTADAFIRTNCLIPMDSNGLIDFGNVDNILKSDKSYPYGMKTDYEKILKEIEKLNKDVSLIVIETGDLNRLNHISDSLSDEMYKYHKDRIIKDADNFIEKLVKKIDKQNTRLIIISPNCSSERIMENYKLSPLVMWGENIDAAILYSETTKRKGIVSNIDIAPSITSYLGAPSDNFSGNKIKFINKSYDNIEFVKKTSYRTNFISNIRYPVLSFYCIMTMTSIVLIILLMLFKLNKSLLVLKCVNICLIAILLIPLIFYLISIFYIVNLYKYILFAIILFIIILFSILRVKKEHKLHIVTGLFFIIIIFDIMTHGNLIKYSVMGYDPAIGARYYGIGNEMIGIFLPTIFFTIAYMLERFSKYRNYHVFAILIFSVIITVHPNMGANLGGTIALIFSSVFFVLRFKKINFNLKRILILFLLIIILILTIILIDRYINDYPTHIGKVISNITNYGFQWFINIVTRKISMNIKLIGVTIWTKVIYVTLLSMIIFTHLFKDKVKSYFEKKIYICVALTSCIFGQIIGFLVNDSGILIASITSIYVAVLFLYDTINYVSNT